MKALAKLLRSLVARPSMTPRLALGLKYPERLCLHLVLATEPAPPIVGGLGRPGIR